MKPLLGLILWATLTMVTSSAHADEPLRHVRIEDSNSQELALHLERQ